MSSAEKHIQKLTDHLFRHESGRMVAVLTRIFGFSNMELAEDVVQEAFAQALRDWTFKIPDNPSAWLMTAAKNKAIDAIRRERYKKTFAEETAILLQSEYTTAPVVESFFMPNEIKDSQLRMIFACCHPALSDEDQIALTLKTCSGFSLDEVSSALLTNPETTKKRIQRAKKFIVEKKIKFDIPAGNELKNRLDRVMHCLYLLFNEGYNSSSKSDLIRKDLCEEALRLALMLTENELTHLPKTFALVALMTLLASRFESRLDESGEIILLEDQDRSKWDQGLIRIGLDYLDKAATGKDLSAYHLEAAIVAEHSMADSFSATNWRHILALYDTLIQVNPSPIGLLNRAIVIGKLEGAERAIAEIKTIREIDHFLKVNYLFPAVLGEMYRLVGNAIESRRYLEAALQLTHSETEKKLLRKKIVEQ